MQSQVNSQPKHGDRAILRLTPPFAGRAGYSRGLMRDHDRRFHFVAMLPTWPRTPLTPDVTLPQQPVFVMRRRMQC